MLGLSFNLDMLLLARWLLITLTGHHDGPSVYDHVFLEWNSHVDGPYSHLDPGREPI